MATSSASKELALFNSLKAKPAGELAPGADLEDATERLFRFLLGKEPTPDRDGQWSQHFKNAVCSLAVQLARNDVSAEDVRQLLQDGSNALAQVFTNAYERNRDALRDALRSIGWEHPKIVGIDWTLSGVMETDTGERVKEPLVEFTLNTISADRPGFEKVSFSCTKNQLQSLNWKFNEALNILQKMAGK
ncbi:COMM domain-containing protein 3-like isoform 4 [Aphelenchoides avenae]|nr:COMM domain-containing protein 3-like isoform 4 [Aphelenchus avenae]